MTSADFATYRPSDSRHRCCGLAWRGSRLTSVGEACPSEATGVNEYAIFAFVVMPIVVVTLGYVAVRLNEWDLDRKRANRELG